MNGGGTYRARSLGPNQTEVAFGVRVIGEGPMAPMWEAMGKPLLPKFARAFAEQFKAEIEQGMAPDGAAAQTASAEERAAQPTFFALVFAWLRRLIGVKATHTTN